MKGWVDIEAAEKIRKERDTLRKQLNIAVGALRYIPCIMVNDGRVWNIDVIEQRIQTTIDNALVEIEKLNNG